MHGVRTLLFIDIVRYFTLYALNYCSKCFIAFSFCVSGHSQ